MQARFKPRDTTLFRVIVADNYHYQDLDEEYVFGDYATEEEALAMCEGIVEESLQEVYKDGITAEGLFAAYTMFGEDPHIAHPRGVEPTMPFRAWDYTRLRAAELVRAMT